MAEPIALRRAGSDDRDFLVDAIVGAERGVAERISYCEIFGLDEPELRALLADILAEDLEGQELCTSGFLVAEIDGAPAAAACGWIEGESELPSTLIKANLLHHFLGAERVERAEPWLARLASLSLPRETGAAQLESIYVRPDQRGRGLSMRVLDAQLRELRARAPELDKAQIILVRDNASARRAYEKLGFAVVRERRTDDPLLRTIVPGGAKILMEKRLGPTRAGAENPT